MLIQWKKPKMRKLSNKMNTLKKIKMKESWKQLMESDNLFVLITF